MVSRENIEQLEKFKFNPMNDAAFKFLFGNEKRKMITLAFLNAVLEPWIGRTIMDLKFLPTESSPNNDEGKVCRLDVVCKLDDNESVDVEVQIANQYNMDHRTLFYWARLFGESLKVSEKYQDIKPCITINILGFNLFSEPKDDPHDVYGICSLKSGRRLNKDMELHFLEIPKYRNYRRLNKIPVRTMTSMERWLAYFANNLTTQEKEELAMADKAISSAMEESSIFLSNPVMQQEYLDRQIAILDYNSNMYSAKQKGIEEGMEKGMEKGVEKVAVQMIKDELPIEQIQRYTSLSPAQIEQLAKENSLL